MAIQSDITKTAGFLPGTDQTLSFTITNASGGRQDCTGFTLEWVLRLDPFSTTNLVLKTGGAITLGSTLSDATKDIVNVAVASANTLALTPGTYFHALWRTDPGQETPLSYGNAVLLPGPP